MIETKLLPAYDAPVFVQGVQYHVRCPDDSIVAATYALLGASDPYEATFIIFRSTDNGDNWTEVYAKADSSLSAVDSTINGMGIIGSTIVAADDRNGKVFRSTDNGQNWTEISVLVGSNFLTVANNTFVLYSQENGFQSSANGSTWSAAFNPTSADPELIGVIQYNHGISYFIENDPTAETNVQPLKLWYTTNAPTVSATWVNVIFSNVLMAVEGGGSEGLIRLDVTMISATQLLVYITDDYGDTGEHPTGTGPRIGYNRLPIATPTATLTQVTGDLYDIGEYGSFTFYDEEEGTFYNAPFSFTATFLRTNTDTSVATVTAAAQENPAVAIHLRNLNSYTVIPEDGASDGSLIANTLEGSFTEPRLYLLSPGGPAIFGFIAEDDIDTFEFPTNVTLQWFTGGADEVLLGTEDVTPGISSTSVFVTETTVFTLTATDTSGPTSVYANYTITINNPQDDTQLTHRFATVYQHTQASASTAWVIQHDLGRYPALDVYIDTDGSKFKVIPLDIVYNNANKCTITFTSPQTGLATIA